MNLGDNLGLKMTSTEFFKKKKISIFLKSEKSGKKKVFWNFLKYVSNDIFHFLPECRA